MRNHDSSWNKFALSISFLVVVLGVFAWLDKPECAPTSDRAAARHVALVVDRSGSMDYLIEDVVDNVNAVLDSLQPNDRVSILFFEDPYGVVRYVEDRPVGEVRRLRYDDYRPYGATPLYDAVGIAIREVVAPTVGSRSQTQYGVVIIVSDGEENSSYRYSASEARQAVASALSQGIDIRFYGMGPAAIREASTLGIPLSNTIQVTETAAGLDKAFEDVRRSLGRANAPLNC